MSTSNEILLDLAIARAMALRGFGNKETKKLIKILKSSDAELFQILWEDIEGVSSTRTRAFTKVVNKIVVMRGDAIKKVRENIITTLTNLGPIEFEAEKAALVKALPAAAAATIITPEVKDLVEEALRNPMAGGKAAARTLDDWFKQLEAVDRRRVTDALTFGISQGMETPRIVSLLRGTKQNGYADGLLALTRRNLEAIVRTGISHVSNSARERIWAANDDIIAGVRWVATLDGRTSTICMGRDGAIAMNRGLPTPKGQRKLDPPNARPPAHPNCRSVMVAVLDPEGVADRLGTRPEKVAGRIGQVPASLTYEEWLRSKSPNIQDDILGKKRGELFRSGSVSLSQFVDTHGKELTLKQLKEL